MRESRPARWAPEKRSHWEAILKAGCRGACGLGKAPQPLALFVAPAGACGWVHTKQTRSEGSFRSPLIDEPCLHAHTGAHTLTRVHMHLNTQHLKGHGERHSGGCHWHPPRSPVQGLSWGEQLPGLPRQQGSWAGATHSLQTGPATPQTNP